MKQWWRAWMLGLTVSLGCATIREPMAPGAGIEVPPELPVLPPDTAVKDPPKAPQKDPRVDPGNTPLTLDEVLATLEANFPLIEAAEQERAIATGLRLSAEGAFDTNLRARGASREGSFENSTLDMIAEQATPFKGISFFSGYRMGLGNFPVYAGGLQTANGGELRTGLIMPLLKDGPIDRRRAVLRQAQINELLADPQIARVRIDAYRAARRAYYNWLATGELVGVAREFAAVARERLTIIVRRQQLGQAFELEVALAKQMLADREGRYVAINQRFQQATIDLSLLYRDGEGRRLLAGENRIPPITSLTPGAVDLAKAEADINLALDRRPEIRRFQLQKERLGVEMRWAQNQMLPGLNVGAAVAQDMGLGKKQLGVFQLDRTFAEAFMTFDVPVQRRDARGRYITARAQMNQILQQERFVRDQIVTEVQSALTLLDRDLQRLVKAKEELKSAEEVVRIARRQFEAGDARMRLFELNLLEVVALDSQAKVVEIVNDYYRNLADYNAFLGLDRD